MLSAACPSCGAPIWFAHAVSLAAVCERCRSTVVRSDVGALALAGKVSVFPRDLSPILLGSMGNYNGRGFVVTGVIRKARDKVRWNEWAIIFDDGRSGWLGEGNGQFQLYDGFTDLEIPFPTDLKAGQVLRIEGVGWQVLEAHSAKIVAAEGELPVAAVDEAETPYADLRLGDGKTAATLDGDFDPVRLYTGKLVALKDLKLDRVRNFTGWSDPDLQAAMSGPEVQGTSSLACPSCTAPLALHTPDALSLACQHCGSLIDLIESNGTLHQQISSKQTLDKRWKPTLALGMRGTIEGLPWEIIGIMDRYVRAEGEKYGWTEYFLFNPYHGYRWLAEDHGTRHWNFIERLVDLPRMPHARRAHHGGHTYRVFQRGLAVVERVIGEFTWEVRQNDTASTVDYVDPPWMLSVETEDNERVATIGKFMHAHEVADAFPDAQPFRPMGIAPNQPNGFDGTGTMATFGFGTVVFSALAVLLFMGQLLWSANETVATYATDLHTSVERSVVVTEPFVLADTLRRSLTVTLASTLPSDQAIVHLTLLNRDDGRATHVPTGRTKGTGRVNQPSAGTYVFVAEVNSAAPGIIDGHRLQLDVVRDKPSFWPVLCAFLVVFIGPLWWFGGRSMFEAKRWANSDDR